MYRLQDIMNCKYTTFIYLSQIKTHHDKLS